MCCFRQTALGPRNGPRFRETAAQHSRPRPLSRNRTWSTERPTLSRNRTRSTERPTLSRNRTWSTERPTLSRNRTRSTERPTLSRNRCAAQPSPPAFAKPLLPLPAFSPRRFRTGRGIDSGAPGGNGSPQTSGAMFQDGLKPALWAVYSIINRSILKSAMSNLGPSMSLGSGMGRAERHAALAFDAALATWDVSASLVRWAARHCGWRAGRRQPGAATGAAVMATPRGQPSPRLYAASTALRYRQISARFTAWNSAAGRHAAATPDVLGFLTTIAATDRVTGGCSAHCDPHHLALRRTTICALRATVDRSLGMDVTAGMPLPPRPQPLPAADPGSVTALRAAVQSPRERLLVLLACDLGLRPGQMVALRWSDVCLRQGLLYVSARGSRLATPIPASCRRALAACARRRTPGDFLFPSSHSGASGPVTTRTLQNALRRLVLRTGLAPKTTFTSLRKACVATPPPGSRRGVPLESCARPTALVQRPPGAGADARGRPGQCSASRTLTPPGSFSPSGSPPQELPLQWAPCQPPRPSPPRGAPAWAPVPRRATRVSLSFRTVPASSALALLELTASLALPSAELQPRAPRSAA
jgi:integrase